MRLIFLILSLSLTANAQTTKSSTQTKRVLEKTPKSLFLIKKIKINPEVGEPQFNPSQAQLRTVINDPALQSTKKYE